MKIINAETWKPLRLYIHKSVLENNKMALEIPETGFIMIECMAPDGFIDMKCPELILGTNSTREAEYEIINGLYDLEKEDE